MTKHIHLVFSDPPAGVSEDEYNEWYDAHVQEILAVDGWVAATRYRLDAVVAADATGGYRYLSLYELDVRPTSRSPIWPRPGWATPTRTST